MLKKELTIKDYEAMKCEKLLEYGANKDYLWLTECETVDNFINWYGLDLALDLGLDKYKYVIYYHESGSVHAHGGFNNLEEFEKACQFVGNYLNMEY